MTSQVYPVALGVKNLEQIPKQFVRFRFHSCSFLACVFMSQYKLISYI